VLVTDLGLLLAAAWATGGASSPFGLLLPARLALAWQGEGHAAARFFAAVSLPASALMLARSGFPPRELSSWLLPAAVVLAAPALLVALEISGARAPDSTPAPAVAVPAAATEAAAPERDGVADLLHDLKSPLSVIRIYSDLIRESASRGQLPNREHLDNLAREVDLAEKLVGEDRVGRPAPRSDVPPATTEATAVPATADLVEILGSLATAYRLGQGARHRIEFIAERPQLTVAADPVALQRALRNVIENALKYTEEGGEIRIRAGAAGPHAFVVVKDTGIGMTPEERARAFDYAFRGTGAVRSGRPGKGLGLALTREILEANGGRIAISSEVGFGSEVTILLPFQRGTR
jgi:signal transduction histidine kinase